MRKLYLIILNLYLCQAACGQLAVRFTADVAGGCSPLVVHFSDQTSGASSTAAYQWDLGNGNSSAQPGPVAVYTQPGSYTVRLTVRDGTQTGSYSQTVVVDQPPVAAFSVSDTRVCAPTPIQFSSNSTPGGSPIASYLWDFGDGSTQAGASPVTSHGYAAAGRESVSLTVTDQYGCSSTATQAGLLTILPRMDVAFSEDKSVLCAVGDPVQFTNGSTGPGTLSYSWSFGDGGTSAQVNPSYSYAARGTYSVQLTVTSSLGCTSNLTQPRVVNVANYQAAFSAPSGVCVGSLTLLTDQSTPAPTRQQWLVDGAVMPVPPYPPVYYGFPLTGTHTVTLNAFFGGCEQTVSKTVTVNPLPVMPAFDQTEQGVCGGPATVNFLDHTPGAVKWAWLFNYGYNPNRDTAFGGPGNLTVYPNGSFQTQLTVTDANGCRATETEWVTVSPPGGVFIEDLSGQPEGSCGPPITRQFSSPGIGNLSSWTWNFGDGTSSTAPSPSHTFSAPGGYNTTLDWTDKNGCTGSSNIVPTIISAVPDLSFTASDTVVCVGQQLGISVPQQFDGAYVSWTFGDGTQYLYSSGNVVHTYLQPGVYTVELQVTTFAGCYAQLIKPAYITVLPSPGIGLSYTNSCTGNWGDVVFHVAAANATTLHWTFGDGTPDTVTDGTVTQLVHNYKDGYFPMTVTATNGNCQTTADQSVNVTRKPKSVNLSLSSSTVCADGSLTATVTVQNDPSATSPLYFEGDDIQYADGTHLTYESGTGGGTASGETYSWPLSYFLPGESGLRIILQTYTGCADTTNTVPLVIGGPNAGFVVVADHQCYQQPVVLRDTTASPGGDPIVSWNWDFGDGSNSTQGGTVSHLYPNPGYYAVRLSVKDAAGCSSTSSPSMPQVVVDGPKAQFIVTGGPPFLPGSAVGFYNTSFADPVTTQYSWDFGDRSPLSTASYPTHGYGAAGVYTVVLTARDASGGCVSTYTQTVVVEGVNTAFSKAGSYVSSGSCPPVLVQFTNQSVNYSSLTWDFGDGVVVVNVPNPSHVYADPGTYIVQLTAVDLAGRSTTTIDSVIVLAPSAVLAAALPAICAGQADTLHATTGRRVSRYTWDFGDGTLLATTDSVGSHVFLTPGNFVAQLVVTDSLGCSAAATATDRISVHAPPLVALTPPQALVCLGSSVQLSAALSGGSVFSWSPGTGLSDTASAAPLATPLTDMVYTVKVTDAIGCSDSGSIPVSVVRPDTLVVSPDSAAICLGKEVGLLASGADSYQWIGAVDGLSATSGGAVTASPAVTTVYRVVGGDRYGCFMDTAAVRVTVLPQPTVDAGPDLRVIAETPVTIAAVGGGATIVAWQWTPATDLSCTDCQQPVCTPRSARLYTVTVTAADGCVASDTVAVNLECDEAKVRIPEAFTPNGDGHNDRWTILGAISIVDHLAIYDRWGARVFQEDHFYPADPNSGWDGTVAGRPAPAGVYAYYVEMRCPTGGMFARKGTVVLVR